MIHNLMDISKLIIQGEQHWEHYGRVNSYYEEGLICFSYKPECQYEQHWNWFELNSRGLIFNQEGKCLARPWYKFFNYGERMPLPGSFLVEVSEKLDGSLGILFQHQGAWHLGTRGSGFLSGSISRWATEYLHHHSHSLNVLDVGTTYLFEILGPLTRVVLDYPEGLALIGARQIATGSFMYGPQLDVIAADCGWLRPKYHPLDDIHELVDTMCELPPNQEGYVLRYSDHEFYKLKGEAYKRIHKIVSGATQKNILQSVIAGTFSELIANIPDEFLDQIKDWKNDIDEALTAAQALCQTADTLGPDNAKDFAHYVQSHWNKNNWAMIFAYRQGKDWQQIVLKQLLMQGG